jgi:hypothetical protein
MNFLRLVRMAAMRKLPCNIDLLRQGQQWAVSNALHPLDPVWSPL